MTLPSARLVSRAMRISGRVLRVFPSLGKLGNLSIDNGDARDDARKNGFAIYSQIPKVTKPVQSANLSTNLLKLNM